MGRILQIRLSAATYSEEDVFASWPKLCNLAWPGRGEKGKNGWKPNANAFAPPVKAEPARFGVLNLVHDLLEESQFADWDKPLKDRLQAGMVALQKASDDLEKALADWQPQAANKATDAIEDALGALENDVMD